MEYDDMDDLFDGGDSDGRCVRIPAVLALGRKCHGDVSTVVLVAAPIIQPDGEASPG